MGIGGDPPPPLIFRPTPPPPLAEGDPPPLKFEENGGKITQNSLFFKVFGTFSAIFLLNWCV